jgi:predicted ATPase
MLTRIEINGFKTFENFELDLDLFCAVVGPNASGKSNLFDALRFLSALAQSDIRTAMKDLRGEAEELFRITPAQNSDQITFAIEVLLPRSGVDAFGQEFSISSQRLRYELAIARRAGADGGVEGLFVDFEQCGPIKKSDDQSSFVRKLKEISYGRTRRAFISMRERTKDHFDAIEVRQDGPSKHGRPITLAVANASRTALSTITTSEFPHLYALREFLSSIHFLQIDPQAARRPSDRLTSRDLAPNASNLATVLARIQSETASPSRPLGALADIGTDLTSLIPSVRSIVVQDDERTREYAFDIRLNDDLSFSSRVISDGTLRLLALMTILNDPKRSGMLCFEEPENGVHEGRIPQLVKLLRDSCNSSIENADSGYFQILTNTHSPAVMQSLQDEEIIVADIISEIDPKTKQKISKTRMRKGVKDSGDLIDPEKVLTRFEIDSLLRKTAGAA